MAAPDNDRYIAKFPMPEGGVIKTGGELMSQKEWDERIENCPESYEVVFDYLSRKKKREAEFKQRAEARFLQQRKKDMIELCKYFLGLCKKE